MNKYSFSFGTFTSDMVGLRLKTLPDEVVPARKHEKLNISTRDGDLLRDYETYDPYTLTLDCYVVNDYTLDNIRNLKAMLAQTEGELVLNWNPDKVYQARLISQVNFKEIIDNSASVQIQFELQPYATLKSGQKVVEGKERFTLINPTAYNSKPIIKVIPINRLAKFYVNDVLVSFVNLAEELILDSELEECYNEKGDNLNHYLDIQSDFPILKPDVNTFETFGCELKIIPNWREL